MAKFQIWQVAQVWRREVVNTHFEFEVEVWVAVNMNNLIKLLIPLLLLGFTISNLVHKKFEYKYSFKPPYLAQKDGSVPFWEYGGSK